MGANLYHVRIALKSNPDDPEFGFNLHPEELEEGIITPYREGRTILLNGRIINSQEIDRISIRKTTTEPSRSKIFQGVLRVLARFYSEPDIEFTASGPNVTGRFILGPPGDRAGNLSDSRNVFVVHGRNLRARDEMSVFLTAVGLHPLDWSEAVQITGEGTPYVGQVLDEAFARAQAVVVLFTPDDEARLMGEFVGEKELQEDVSLTGQARPNVLFEAGMALGRSAERTIIVELGILRPFSDIAGRHTKRPHENVEWRRALADRLKTAGCPVNLEEGDWCKASDLECTVVTPKG